MNLASVPGDLDLEASLASTLEKETGPALSLTGSSEGTDITVETDLEDIIIDEDLVEILIKAVEIQEIDIERAADQEREDNMKDLETEEDTVLMTKIIQAIASIKVVEEEAHLKR